MHFNALDLNLVRVFDALVRERSATRAGDRIGLSQPAVSAALSRLPDPSLAADVARSKRLKELQKQLAAIKPSELSAQAELNREFLEWTLERQIQRLAFDEARMPFSSDDGFDWTISYLASSTPMPSRACVRSSRRPRDGAVATPGARVGPTCSVSATPDAGH